MGQMPSRYSIEEGEKFHELLSQIESRDLLVIFEYFKNDLIYIVECGDVEHLLEYLDSGSLLDKETYMQMRRDLGPRLFSRKLVQDVRDARKEVLVGFLEGIYDLQSHPPNLLSLRDELDKFGETLIEKISLDRRGHPSTIELIDTQEHHRRHLLERTMLRPTDTEPNEDLYVSGRHMDMIVSHVRPYNRTSEHRLLETAMRHKDYSQRGEGIFSPDRLFRWCFKIKCAPHAVMVTGVPGIGKTTFLEKLVCDWADGKVYQRFSFVFFLKFRDLNKFDKISLESMILHQYPYLQDHLVNVLRNPERLLFIFDGLDESVHEIDFKSRQLCHDIKQEGHVGAIVVGLAKQSLLKGCSLLLTSQQDRLAGVNIGVFKRVLEIIGFFPQERQLYMERFFKNKELSDKVFSFVRDNGVLYTLCYNPSYCWTLCTVLSKCLKDQPTNGDPIMSPPPKTLTQLYVAFIVHILSAHSLDTVSVRSLLTSLGWMAEHGLRNHVTKFNNQTFSQFNVDRTSKHFPAFMKEYTSFPEPSFSFLHPITQEFLAALVHYIDYSPEKLQRSLEEAKSYKDNRDELFLSFLCGLSDVSTRTILQPYLGDLSSDATRDVLSWLSQCLGLLQAFPETQILDYRGTKRQRLLNLFHKFFEVQNKDFLLESLGSFRRFNFDSMHLTPLNCSVISYIVQTCRETEEFCLGNCNIEREDMERLAPALHTIPNLSLGSNKFGDDGVKVICLALQHPECKIRSLCLTSTGLTHRACSYLGPAMSMNQSLRTLELSYNDLEGPHFGDLAAALSSPSCKLEELRLDSTRLTDSSSPLLASGLRRNQSLKTLHLSFNNLIGPHLGDLMAALSSSTCTVEQLILQDICLEDEYLPFLIPPNNRNLTHLDLSHNSISGAGTAHLRELILQSPSLKQISLFMNRRLPEQDRRSLLELRTQKPDLDISVD